MYLQGKGGQGGHFAPPPPPKVALPPLKWAMINSKTIIFPSHTPSILGSPDSPPLRKCFLEKTLTLRKLVLQLRIANCLGSLAHLPHQLCQPTDATNYTPCVGEGEGGSGVLEQYQGCTFHYVCHFTYL